MLKAKWPSTILGALARLLAVTAGIAAMLLLVISLFVEAGTSGPASMGPPLAALAWFVLDVAALRAVFRPRPTPLAWLAALLLPVAAAAAVLHSFPAL